MKNRFNLLTSKEWLPFQKSWFKYETDSKLYSENIRFFTKAGETDSVVLYSGNNFELAEKICTHNDLKISKFDNSHDKKIQFAIFDMREELDSISTLNNYQKTKEDLINKVLSILSRIEDRRFISIFIKNVQSNDKYFPFAWDLAKNLSTVLSLKDEKIACLESDNKLIDSKYFQPAKDVFYCLYFRKDENSNGKYEMQPLRFFENNKQQEGKVNFKSKVPSWVILKPQPRKKNEILHPAKYPEDLVEMFINEFTCENENVFDPMAGTGSTQLGALKCNRNAYGTELSRFFTEIAISRCREFLAPTQKSLFFEEKSSEFNIINKDARLVNSSDFPEIDYIITSPPYWDMLNMKGAEYQAKRKQKGLQTNYSDDSEDLGNIADYYVFVNELAKIYFSIMDLMKPKSYMTIVVKNIKKKGKNYPLAWDLTNILMQKLILLPETFWCQDDISIAPYGYGNTWVSNTFHQYCLTFQKPG